jgi:hypothetical protein
MNVGIRAILLLHPHADSTIALEQHFQDARRLVDGDAQFTGVIEHHCVKFAPHDLPRLGTFVRFVVMKIKRRGFLAGGIYELHAVFLDEVALLHFIEHADPFEHPIGFRNQRFADMEPRKRLALIERDIYAALGEHGRNGTSGGTTANNDHIERFF